MELEKKIFEVFSNYLENHGYELKDEEIEELIEVYMDCQEWIDDYMTTGESEIEMIDWIKHTKEVETLLMQNSLIWKLERCIAIFHDLLMQNRKCTNIEYLIDIA